jgi:hypothetical protein
MSPIKYARKKAHLEHLYYPIITESQISHIIYEKLPTSVQNQLRYPEDKDFDLGNLFKVAKEQSSQKMEEKERVYDSYELDNFFECNAVSRIEQDQKNTYLSSTLSVSYEYERV